MAKTPDQAVLVLTTTTDGLHYPLLRMRARGNNAIVKLGVCKLTNLRSLQCSIDFESVSIMVYVQYFAGKPGESHLPSPETISDFP